MLCLTQIIEHKKLKILIIGGSGGIGSALIKTLTHFYPDTTLYATYYTTKPEVKHPNLTWFKVDISSESGIKKLSENIPNLDVLINAAGMLHLPNHDPERSINEFDLEFFNHNLSSNTVPTILLAKHFSKHLKSKQHTYFTSISARIGSIEDNMIGGWISYRCSKAALNMAIKTISIEWKYKVPNCCVFAFHPGTTDTYLSKPFQRNVAQDKLFSTDFVALTLLQLIEKMSPDETGKFFCFTGEQLPW